MATRTPGLADAPLLRGGAWRSRVAGAGVVHAPGGAIAARVPGAARRGQHPRRHPRPRPGRRDHAAAGAPLRGRRRHPLQRHRRAGRGHRLRRRRHPRRRPGGRRAVPLARPTSTGCGRSSPTSTRPTSPRPCATVVAELGGTPLIGFAGAPFTVASYLIEGRPSRTYGLTKAMMHGEPTLWHELLDRLADIAIASLLAQVEAGASAIQLFDSWAGALSPDVYARARAARTAPRCSRRSRPSACRASTSASAPASCSALMGEAGADVVGVDWRVPLDVARERVPGQGRAGQPRPGRVPGAVGRGRRPHPRRAAPQRRPPRPHLQPRPRRAARARPRRAAAGGRPRARGGPHGWLSRLGVVVMAYGTPASPDDVEAYYTHIRRGTRPPPEQLADLVRRYDAIGGTSPLAERTEAQRAGLAAALEERAPGGAAWCSARSTPRRSSRTRWRALADDGVDGSSAWCWPRTTRGASVGEYHDRLAPPPPSAALRVGDHRQLAPRADLPRLPRRRRARTRSRAARAHQGAVHRPLAARAGAGRRPLPRPAAASRPPRSPRPSGSTAGRAGRRAGSRPAARPSRGAGPTSST